MTSSWLDSYALMLCAVGVGTPVAGLLGTLCSRSRRAAWMWAPLIPGGPLASLLLAFIGTAPVLADLPPETTLADLGLRHATHVQACTDQGTPVRVHHATIAPDKLDGYQAQQILLRELGLADSVTILSAGWRNCNCHGWVFADGHFFVKSEEVEAILHDNGYGRVDTPESSDLAVYRRTDGQIVHTGIVRVNAGGQIRVESKWGALGLFLHPADAHPYDHAACTFYHAERGSHVLQGLRDAPGEDVVQ
jgi:hypothetical protein